ncbi:MAG: Nif3-like dinuclear metal center hexameric protein [Oceanospirillaceae bacterium]|nr:Nif3-like dinuclear metal center hexameric protein [Oceanospirillaceae bacterium]
MSISRKELVNYLDQRLTPERFRDYAPNGLQVEGCEQVSRIVTGVTASQALIDAAVAWNADAILVHHGYFWKGENPCITGMKQRRIKTLLQHDINLLGYHLPLDAHPDIGNNAVLAKLLGITVTGGLEEGNPLSIGVTGKFDVPMSLQELGDRVSQVLKRPPLLIAGGEHQITTIGLCTGGAQGYIEKAIDLGLDAYLSGEISEPTVHSARENGVHYVAAGHHATERFGAKTLGEELAQKFGIEQMFVDIDNPV